MKILLRRLSSTATLAALLAVPAAIATPTISFTPGQFPATGSPAGVVSTPAGLTISVNATPTAGSSIVSVTVSVNGSAIGSATGASPFTVPWFPTVAGTYTVSATVQDTSAITTGAGASTNTATINSIVTISTARAALVVAPANNATLVQNSQIFLRSSAAMSDGVVQRVDFVLDPGTPGEIIIGTANQAPFNVPFTVAGLAVGSHTLLARATASDGVTVFDSPTLNLNVVTAVGNRPTATITSPAAGAFVATSSAITVTATATDSDGFIPSTAGGGVIFFADGDPIGTDLTAPYAVSWTPTVAKSYSLVAQAVDDRGNIGQSLPLSVTAVATLPTVTVSAPGTASVGTAVTLSATATPSPGATVTQVAFFANGVAIGAPVAAAPYSVLWTPTQVGANAITAQVTDSVGIVATSAISSVTVAAASGTSVVLNSPVNGATIPQGSQIFLRSTASIAGNIVSRVDFYLDGLLIPGASVGQSPYNLAFTVNESVGVHTVLARAVASDGVTTVDSATAVINVVGAVGAPPAVALTAPTTGSFVASGAAITLSATATDGDGFIATTTGGGVTFFVDGDPVANDLTAPYTASWTPTTAKTYSIRAQTVDDKGNVVLSAPVSVTAVPALPTVTFSSPPSSATIGVDVTLTASASASPGASVTQVVFFANGAPIGAPATVAPYTVAWTPAALGSTVLTAQVTDSVGITATSTAVNVNVSAAGAAVSITSPITGSVHTVGAPVTMTATASASPGATVAQVQFLVGGSTIIGTDTTFPYSINWTPSAAANFSLTAKVTDTNGVSATSAAVSVTAVSATSVSLSAPANNSAATVGLPTNLTASAAAIAGSTITSVSFFDGATLIATVGSAPFTTAWIPGIAGASTITAQATDSNGTTVTSLPITINVANSPPAIALTAPAIGSVVTAGTAVTISATATPGSGGAVVSQVQFLAGATVVATLPGTPGINNYSASWTPGAAGNFSLTARVTDSNGGTTTSTAVSVTAVAAATPTATMIAPATGSVVTLGSSVVLSATATAGSGATVAQVQFLAGTNIIGTTTTTPGGGVYSVLWTPTTVANFSLTARVLDTAGNSATSPAITVTTVAATSVSLTAPANNSTATVGAPTTITASAAPIAGATITSVSFFDGATLIATVVSAPFTTAWIPVIAGASTITAQATDSNGTPVSSAPVTVNVVNSPPTIALTAPLAGSVVTAGSPVTLTATAAAGSGGAAISQVQFLAGGAVVATLPGTAGGPAYTAQWTPASAANFSLTARVTDTNGNTTTSTAISVTAVAAASPTVNITAPTTGSVVTVGTALTVSAVAAPGAGASVAQVQFLAGANIIGTTTTTPGGGVYSVLWTPTSATNFSLTARVLDTAGNSTTSPVISVTAVVATAVSLTAPANNSTAVVGTAVALTASATPTAGAAITRVEFFEGATSVGFVTTAPFTLLWSPTVAGPTVITAQATDSNGTIATSSAINVTVNNSPPVVALTAPSPGTVATAGTPVTLTASATAGSGGATITRVQFLAGNAVVQTLPGDPLSAVYSGAWTPSVAGDFNVTARVTDSNGNTTTSTPVSVTVQASASTSIAITSPVAGTIVSVGTPVAISANADVPGGTTVTQVQFLVGSTVIATQAGNPASPTYGTNWTPTAAGSFNLTARVTDSAGTSRTSPVVQVTSLATSVTLSMLPSSINIPVNSSRVITATASAPAGIAAVEFYYFGLSGLVLIGTDTAPPYNIVFTAPNEPGSRILRARAIDTTGAAINSGDFNINISGQLGTPPLVGILTPVSGTFVAAGNTTQITGTVSDADGSISSVQVFVNGITSGLANNGAATVSGANWTINWTPTAAGTASISAIAVDNTGNAVTAPAVGVNVTDSLSPVINLSLSPRTAAAGASTTLPSGAARNLVADATASSGRAVLRVEFFVDGTKVGEDTSAPYTYRYVAPALGDGELSRPYVLSARATDNAGAARDTQLSVLVISPVGAPPNVNLLTPANGATSVPGTAISLAATATSIDSTIAAVQFYVNGSPAGINGGNGITAAPFVSSFTPTTPGTYTIDAIATDARGNTSVSGSATVTAAFATPTIVFTSPNPNAVARATPGVPLTLAATATFLTGGGAQILLVEFLLDGVQIGADTTAPYSFSWIPTAAQLGEHVLTARVTDTNSQVVTSLPLTVNVANVVGSPPTVSVSANPIPAGGLQTASTVNFLANAVATGTGSTLRNVEIFLNDISIGLATREQNTNIYRRAFDLNQFDFTTVTPNINETTGAVTYPVRLYAIARDSNNNQTVSSTVNLVINPATSAAPTIQLQALSPTNITAGTQFFIQANINDPDGNVTNIQLYANGTLVGQSPNPQQGQLLTYTANTAGRFNLYAVATDETGNTAVSSPSIVINVTALSAPTTTITRPTDNTSTTTVGAPVFLEGTAINTVTTQVPTLQFIATAAGGARQVITGTRIVPTTSYRAIWTPTNPDTYTISTQASIGNVQGTSSASRRVVVSDVIGLAPSITLTRAPGVSGFPGSAQTASTADFAATAQDPDGAVVEVEFFLNRYSIGQARRDPQGNTWRLTAAFAGLQPGATEVVALARDSTGNVVASNTGNINVTAAASIAPSITITPSSTNPAFNRQIQLRANARDTDGTVTSVVYYANATAIATSTNSGSLFLTNWTPTASGLYYLWAVATDSSGITTVSPTVEVNVRRNNPVLEDAAFILQTYQDIANTTNINPLVFDDTDNKLGDGSMTRADLVVSLLEQPGFQAPVQLLATYYVLMGRWPTPQDYTTFLSTARGNLANAVGGILNANDYFAKYGAVPTTTLLNNPTSVIPARTFLDRLWANAGSSPSTNRETDLVRFMNNNVASATIGRGYNAIGVNQAIGEFVTLTNSANKALFDRARAAAIFFQLARPPITVTVEEITARVDALMKLPDIKAIADAVLKDVLYGYRYVTITKHPQSLTVSPRAGAIFTVEAQGAPPLVYQWLLNGAPIAGATNPTLSLTNLDATRVGTYSAVITSAAGVATSDPATLTLSNVITRLANISTRGVTTGGANALIGGFVVTGTQAQNRQMLVRVIGPTLANAPFNVAGTLANPGLALYSGSNPNPVLTNDNWGTQTAGAAQVAAIQQAANRAGAFALPANSLDAAILATLPPGAYTVMATVPAATPNVSGVVLIEVYDVTQGGPAGPRAANVSTRGQVGTGTNQLIAGFVVTGGVSRRILIRGAGPALTGFGVPGVLADPQLSLVAQDSGQVIRLNDNWSSGDDAGIIASAATTAGAFPFGSGSRDAAMIVMLPPGAYTVQLTGVGNTTGVGIVEVYDVDP
jgi:hypothetical protein